VRRPLWYSLIGIVTLAVLALTGGTLTTVGVELMVSEAHEAR
jgi:hypothetical protein